MVSSGTRPKMLENGAKRLGVNESLRPNATLKLISNDIKLDLWPIILFKKRMSQIIGRHFLSYLKRILSKYYGTDGSLQFRVAPNGCENLFLMKV